MLNITRKKLDLTDATGCAATAAAADDDDDDDDKRR